MIWFCLLFSHITVQIPFICSADQVKVIDDRWNDGMAGLIRTGRWCCEIPRLWGSWHPYLLPSHTRGCQTQILQSCCRTVEKTAQGAGWSCFELCRVTTLLVEKQTPKQSAPCHFPCPWDLHWNAEEKDQEEHQHHCNRNQNCDGNVDPLHIKLWIGSYNVDILQNIFYI